MRTRRYSITLRHAEFQIKPCDVYAFTSLSTDIKLMAPLLTLFALREMQWHKAKAVHTLPEHSMCAFVFMQK